MRWVTLRRGSRRSHPSPRFVPAVPFDSATIQPTKARQHGRVYSRVSVVVVVHVLLAEPLSDFKDQVLRVEATLVQDFVNHPLRKVGIRGHPGNLDPASGPAHIQREALAGCCHWRERVKMTVWRPALTSVDPNYGAPGVLSGSPAGGYAGPSWAGCVTGTRPFTALRRCLCSGAEQLRPY